MPSAPARASIAPAASSQVQPTESKRFGQVVEYIEDRLFLASYSVPPTENTLFPFQSKRNQTPNKRKAQSRYFNEETDIGVEYVKPIYFSIDDHLLYNAFCADFGPLHIGHTFRFAILLHELLGNAKNDGKVFVFWSYPDSRSRANAACLLACYMVLIQHWPPHLALAPISQMDPPLMPFRDAGYAQADYILNVQDVVYGVWRAKNEGLCSLDGFSLQEYEAFERVDMGDFNWVTPYFLAFASPQHGPTDAIPQGTPEFAALPKTSSEIKAADLPHSFKMVLWHFRQKRIGLVVRLNNELYSPSYFTALGMAHIDMIFEDGTCPPLPVVRKFIKIAHHMITVTQRGIAVHCKAGLGRTGCLIGAYLIYRHGFTANEVIAFMRFMRPGMVVGPQQHWLHINQNIFRQWWYEDSVKDKLSLKKAATPPRTSNRPSSRLNSNAVQTHTPPALNSSQQSKRKALGELDYNEQTNGAIPTATAAGKNDENLPAPTPGQPRKSSKRFSEKLAQRPHNDSENDMSPMPQPNTDIITVERQNSPQRSEIAHAGESEESEEEIQLRMLSHKAFRSPSGNMSSSKKRAVTTSITTTGTSDWAVSGMDEDLQLPLPNGEQQSPQPGAVTTRSPQSGNRTTRTGSGAGALSVGKRGSATARKMAERNGVVGRKASANGRVGSAGSVAGRSSLKQ